MKTIFTFLLIILFFSTSKLSAQEVIEMQSKTKGISAGIDVGYISYSSSQLHANTEGGLGYGVVVQYGFNHKFAGAFSYQHFDITSKDELDRVENNPYPYNEVSLIGKYIFGSTTTKLRPFISLGGAYTKSKENYRYTFDYLSIQSFSGFSFGLGAGLSYFVNPQISLDLSVLYNSGSYTTNYTDGVLTDFYYDFSSIKGLAGASYHF